MKKLTRLFIFTVLLLPWVIILIAAVSGPGGGTSGPIISTLNDLQDVSVDAPSNGDALVWDTVATAWVPGSVASSGSSSIFGSITLTNLPNKILGTDGLGVVSEVIIGNGLQKTDLLLAGNFASLGAGQNNNELKFRDFWLVSPLSLPVVTNLSDNITLDFSGTNMVTRTVVTNVLTVNFTNLPTDGRWRGPLILVASNAATVYTNSIIPNWVVPGRDDWMEQQDPALVPQAVHEFWFWFNGAELKGKAFVPSLQENEYTSQTLTANNATTNYWINFNQGSFAFTIATADVYSQLSTNRPLLEYGTVKTKQWYVKASGANRPWYANPSWRPAKDNTNMVYTITNGTTMAVSIAAEGPAETNVVFATRFF